MYDGSRFCSWAISLLYTRDISFIFHRYHLYTPVIRGAISHLTEIYTSTKAVKIYFNIQANRR